MRLATVRTADGLAVARVDDEHMTPVADGPLDALLADPRWRDRAQTQGTPSKLDAARLAPVVVQPRKVICLGHNFRTHIEEMGRELPNHPTLFAKFARALVGARDDIVLPAVSESMDWEAELAVVIGTEVRNANEEEAREAIAGYTVMNDVSARDYQFRTLQWLQGKSFQSTTPLGPWLVTPDEIDHARDLKLRCRVNGQVMQESTTADLLFWPADVVAYISQIITLDPGDVISLGTPAGVGAGRDPKVFLQDGDVVETTIEGIGTLRNTCRAEG